MAKRALAGLSGAAERPFCRRIIDEDVAESLSAEAVDEGRVLLGELRLPRVQVADLSHVSLQELLQAAEAGLQGAVERAAFDGDAEAGGGEQCVLLRVDADAQIVAFARRVGVGAGAAVAAALFAVAHLRRRAVVAGAEDAVVADDQRADAPAGAVGARAHRERDAHEVGVRLRFFWRPGHGHLLVFEIWRPSLRCITRSDRGIRHLPPA